MLRPAALAERLRDPEALEAFSPLTGAALLEVDLHDADPAAPVPAALTMLPCVTLGRGGDPASPLAAALDVVARDDAEADAVRKGVAAAPLAACALAQLLRMSEALPIHDALVAESLVYSTLQAGPEFRAWRAAHPVKAAEPNPEHAVLVAREGARMRLRLNRPERRNAFSVEMRDAFCEALRLAMRDDQITEIVLEGEGPAFSSGGDLDEFGSFPDPSTAHQVRAARSPARTLALVADRTTARVHGACIGAGAELPAFCRRVVAHRDAFFQLPEVGFGLVPGAGGTVSLPRRIGRERTAWLALSGARIDAETARRLGLVDEIEAG